jgi:hypothetical protein
LFDVLLDDNVAGPRLARYRAVFVPDLAELTPDQRSALQGYIDAGGTVVDCQPEESGEAELRGDVELTRPMLAAVTLAEPEKLVPHLDRWLPERSGVEGPGWIALTCFSGRGGGRLIAHLVNYRRERDPVREAGKRPLQPPIPQENIPVVLRLPRGSRVASVRVMTPERPEPRTIEFVRDGRQVRFTVPRMDAYAVAVVEMEPGKAGR